MGKHKHEKKIVFKVTIEAYDNGSVTVNGPMDNFPGMIDVLNSAERAVIDRLASKIKQKSNIVMPDLAPRPGFRI